MNVIPLPTARVSDQMRSSQLLSSIQDSQSSLLKVEQQISTGQRLSLPSDDPAAAVGIMGLRRQLDDNVQSTNNLTFAKNFLNTADGSLSTVSTLITQAQSVASSMASNTVSAAQRSAQSSVIDNILQQVLAQANTRYQNQAVFGGANGVDDPFTSTPSGYKYQGSDTQQNVLLANNQSLSYTVDGNTIFGGLSAQVIGYQNLSPALSNNTALTDLHGTTGNGVKLGTISITDGTNTASVDLSTAATAGAVVSDIQSALTTAGISGTFSITGDHFSLNNSGGTGITITDSNSTSAADLGIAFTAAAGATTAGSSTQPQLTSNTLLSSLRGGAGIDPSGIQISNGALSATIAISSGGTVGDLLNAINGSGTQVQASINSAGTGINVLNSLSGSALHIGENGGQTADELGIRSFQSATLLSSFNAGQGITPISQTVSGPSGNIIVTRTDGTVFNVNVTGIKTAADLAAAINTAAGNTTVTAAINPTGNGLTLTDTTGGTGNVSVAAGANYQGNGSNLGIFATGSGGTLTGSNVALSTDDLQITRRDGTTFTVNLTGAATVQDVLNAINNAPGNTTTATQVVAGLNTTGNGISLTDPTTGSAAFTVTAVNASPVAAQLGILKTAAGGSGQIAGDDVNGLQPTGLLSSLTALRNALSANDTQGITRAAGLLNNDEQTIATASGQLGAREQDVLSRISQASSDNTSLQESLSLLNDTDMPTAITQYQSLQTAYQASLQVGAATQNLSLLNFLQ